ncbi:MAG: thiamine-phosphate kinase [Acidobacteria bacterium]|nr:thiamine-phosphate kinase [Acidobacteriota bacterium]
MRSAPPPIAGELSLIEHIRRSFPARHSAVALGIGDDCAILRPPRGSEVLVTTDFSLEGRHFRRDLHPAASAGHRCLARGLSDLAAMGASPLAAFLSLAVPPRLLRARRGRLWLEGFFAGIRELASRHGVVLAGGDTAESPADLIFADIVLIGSAPRGRALRRSAARPGDNIYVTGSLGGAHAELTALLASNRPARVTGWQGHPHFFPQPRLAVGSALLRRHLASAAIDLSDGLSTDLTHLCEASGVRAEIDASALPLSTSLAKLTPDAAMYAALHGGEDYELLFTAPGIVPRGIAGVPLTCIGSVHKASGGKPRIMLTDLQGRRSPLRPGGWEHLATR